MNITGNPKLEVQLKKLMKNLEELGSDSTDLNQISDLIHSTFRLIHNIKSNLFLIDHGKSLKLTYIMESYFENFRNGNHIIPGESLRAFVKCIKWISNDIADEECNDALYGKLLMDLKSLTLPENKSTGLYEKLDLSTDEKTLLHDARNSGLNIFITHLPIERDISRIEYNKLPVIKYINNIGMIISKTPSFNNISEILPGTDLILKILFVTDKHLVELDQKILKSAAPFEAEIFLNRKNYRILIVEDNPVTLLLQRSLLSSYGICDDVCDGEAALDLFRSAIDENAPYDIVLLDLVMPGLGGAEVLKEIRGYEETHDIRGLDRSKVIISTTTSESSTLMDLFRAETDAYIIKPMTGEKIERVMRNLKLI